MIESSSMPKAILSTGIGKLHFFESALAIHGASYPLELIMGWRPKGGEKLIDALGQLIGQNLLSKRLAARWPSGLEEVPIYSCSSAEAYATLLTFLSQKGLINSSRAATLGFTCFGQASRKYIKNADIFHVRSAAGQGGAINTARLQGMKILVDHSIAHPSAIKSVLAPEFEKFNLPILSLQPEDEFWQLILKDCEQADLLLVNSDYVKSTFIEAGYPSEKIRVAYLGVRKDFFELKQDYRRSQELKLLFTGHFDLRKGVRILLEALDILEKQKFAYRLDVFGQITPSSLALLNHQRLQNIHFHPFVPQDQLKQIIAEADIFVFPTFAEGASRSAMESMAAGLPVITTKNCGVPIEHGVNGWYVPIADSESLAEAIQHLGTDEKLRQDLGINAAKTVSRGYTWQQYAESVIDVYGQLCSR
jgi:glycosyltransferase involved in cell wall biosynthesis